MSEAVPLSLLSIDPGSEQSAWCQRFDGRVIDLGIRSNAEVLSMLQHPYWQQRPLLVVEDLESFGMPVGRAVFRTAMWIGRFVQAWTGSHVLLPRSEVKLTLCGSRRAKDGNVRQALIDQLGALPTKKKPNPRYGQHRPANHEWSALALALAYEQIAREGRAAELQSLQA